MRAQKALAEQLGLLYATVGANLADMSESQSLLQPPGGGNCANWILGHLTAVHNQLARLLGAAPVWEDPQLARAGFEPIVGPEQAIPWDVMVKRFLESEDRVVSAVEGLGDAEMRAAVPDPFGGTTARGDLLAIIGFHQAYHAGQLAMSRRLAGLPGAVRFPGQDGGAMPGNGS